MSITAHCVVKNEEVFIEYAILSVIDFVDTILVYDTGSTDHTPSLIQKLVAQFPRKIIFEEKGECDQARHTQLRQEMLDKTTTEWFMVLDGDEVWTNENMKEVLRVMREKPSIVCIMAPFYLCVGDIYHQTRKKGSIEMLGRKDFFYPRFIKITDGVHWSGNYNEDTLQNKNGEIFFTIANSYTLTSRYWHMTHLKRSVNDGEVYSSGGTRAQKRKITYFLIGKKINHPLPEVLQGSLIKKLPWFRSFINFFQLLIQRYI